MKKKVPGRVHKKRNKKSILPTLELDSVLEKEIVNNKRIKEKDDKRLIKGCSSRNLVKKRGSGSILHRGCSVSVSSLFSRD